MSLSTDSALDMVQSMVFEIVLRFCLDFPESGELCFSLVFLQCFFYLIGRSFYGSSFLSLCFVFCGSRCSPNVVVRIQHGPFYLTRHCVKCTKKRAPMSSPSPPFLALFLEDPWVRSIESAWLKTTTWLRYVNETFVIRTWKIRT